MTLQPEPCKVFQDCQAICMTLTGCSATQPVQFEALGVVGPRLSKECRERDLSVTDKAAAEIFVFAS